MANVRPTASIASSFLVDRLPRQSSEKPECVKYVSVVEALSSGLCDSTQAFSLGLLKVKNTLLDLVGLFIYSSATGISRKTRLIAVVYNGANNEFVRTNTLVKNEIVQIDAAPFRLWYETHYGVTIGRKKVTKKVFNPLLLPFIFLPPLHFPFIHCTKFFPFRSWIMMFKHSSTYEDAETIIIYY